MGMWKKNNNKPCEHSFEDKFAIVIEDRFPRVVSICKKCGLSVHRKIYSIKEVNKDE